MLRTLLTLVLTTLLVGCETGPQPKAVAHLARDGRGRYEFQLDASYRTCNRGPCRFPSLVPKTFEETDWLYTHATKGRIPASQIVLTHERGKTEDPWPQKGLRGSVTFSHDHMNVDLEEPYYKGGATIDHYERYPLNGAYILEKR